MIGADKRGSDVLICLPFSLECGFLHPLPKVFRSTNILSYPVWVGSTVHNGALKGGLHLGSLLFDNLQSAIFDPSPFPPLFFPLAIKKKYAKKLKQNKAPPYWIRLRTGNRIKWNEKRRHWRRTKLNY
eukprot:gene7608-5368_t